MDSVEIRFAGYWLDAAKALSEQFVEGRLIRSGQDSHAARCSHSASAVARSFSKIFTGIEVAVPVEVVVDRGMGGSEFL